MTRGRRPDPWCLLRSGSRGVRGVELYRGRTQGRDARSGTLCEPSGSGGVGL